MIETHVALLRTLCDAGDLRGADRLKAIAIRAVLDHIEWLEAELERSEKAKIDRILAELSAIEEVDRLRSALTAIETLYATRGWSDGFRERLRQILDGVKTP